MLRITIEIDDKQNVTVNTIAPKAEKQDHVNDAVPYVVKPQTAPQTKVRKDGKKYVTVAEKTCINCGKKFKPASNVQQYCAPECKHKKLITPEQIERSQGKPYKDY